MMAGSPLSCDTPLDSRRQISDARRTTHTSTCSRATMFNSSATATQVSRLTTHNSLSHYLTVSLSHCLTVLLSQSLTRSRQQILFLHRSFHGISFCIFDADETTHLARTCSQKFEKIETGDRRVWLWGNRVIKL